MFTSFIFVVCVISFFFGFGICAAVYNVSKEYGFFSRLVSFVDGIKERNDNKAKSECVAVVVDMPSKLDNKKDDKKRVNVSKAAKRSESVRNDAKRVVSNMSTRFEMVEDTNPNYKGLMVPVKPSKEGLTDEEYKHAFSVWNNAIYKCRKAWKNEHKQITFNNTDNVAPKASKETSKPDVKNVTKEAPKAKTENVEKGTKSTKSAFIATFDNEPVKPNKADYKTEEEYKGAYSKWNNAHYRWTLSMKAQGLDYKKAKTNEPKANTKPVDKNTTKDTKQENKSNEKVNAKETACNAVVSAMNGEKVAAIKSGVFTKIGKSKVSVVRVENFADGLIFVTKNEGGIEKPYSAKYVGFSTDFVNEVAKNVMKKAEPKNNAKKSGKGSANNSATKTSEDKLTEAKNKVNQKKEELKNEVANNAILTDAEKEDILKVVKNVYSTMTKHDIKSVDIDMELSSTTWNVTYKSIEAREAGLCFVAINGKDKSKHVYNFEKYLNACKNLNKNIVNLEMVKTMQRMVNECVGATKSNRKSA